MQMRLLEERDVFAIQIVGFARKLNRIPRVLVIIVEYGL